MARSGRMRKVGWLGLIWLVAAIQARGQDRASWDQAPPPNSGGRPTYLDQPIVPNDPTIERRRPGQDRWATQPPPADAVFYRPGLNPRQELPYPFNPPLSHQQEAELDRVLFFWEQSSKNIKTFACGFERLDYDPLDPARRPNEPRVDRGEIQYSAPDKALFLVKGEKGETREHWACDGKAVYEMDPVRKLLIVHKLPPEMQGKAIADGPVPFLFGAKAAQLKQRYYLRIITPDAKRQQEVWLEAWPRLVADAQNFKYAELILAIGQRSLTPTAVQIHHPNGKNRVVYTLSGIEVNKTGFGAIFGNPFEPKTPRGWQRVVEEPPHGPPPLRAPAGRDGPPSVGIRPGVGRG
jgi:TIGR03009 family protein